MDIASIKPVASLPEDKFDSLFKRSVFKINHDLESFGAKNLEPVILTNNNSFFLAAGVNKIGFAPDGHFYLNINPDSFKIEDLFKSAVRAVDHESLGPVSLICPIDESDVLVILYDSETSALAAKKTTVEKEKPGPFIEISLFELKEIIDLI